jgi:hypothetical protein
MDSSAPPPLTLVDSHVHFYGSFEEERFFSAAFDNVAAQASSLGAAGAAGALLLTESSGEGWFGKIAARAGKKGGGGPSGSVTLSRTDEDASVAAVRAPGETLYIVAGSQIVTRERLELLALCTTGEFRDGKPAEAVVEEVQQAGGLPVLPWAAGKWWGERGKIAARLLDAWKARGLRCADSGVRPLFWPSPPQFGASPPLLRGSDPLPLPGEEERVGSFGSALPVALSERTPAADLKRYLLDGATAPVPYGKPAGAWHFLSAQLRLRLGRRHGKGAAG